MLDIRNKQFGSAVTPDEWNSFAEELATVIEATGQTLSGLDTAQVLAAITDIVIRGTAFIDSGVANTYVLNAVPPFPNPTALVGGDFARFIALNNNTGASTVDVGGLGALPIVSRAGVALVGGEILVNQETWITYNPNTNDWRLFP